MTTELDTTCNGKRCYGSSKAARAILNLAKRSRRLHGGPTQIPIRTYHCDDCGFWHLSSQHTAVPEDKRNDH